MQTIIPEQEKSTNHRFLCHTFQGLAKIFATTHYNAPAARRTENKKEFTKT